MGREGKANRPRISLPLTSLEVFLEACAFLGILFLLWSTLSAWPGLPDKVPTHFGFAGKPDAWGSKDTLWILPAATLGLCFLLTLVEPFPHVYNYPVPITPENAGRQYRIARRLIILSKAIIVWLFTYMQWSTIQVAQGRAPGLGEWFLPAMLALLALVTITHIRAMVKER